LLQTPQLGLPNRLLTGKNMHIRPIRGAAVACITLTLGAQAPAQDSGAQEHPLGQHPAILVQRTKPGIDPNTFIPAHPARLSLVATPSQTYDHPVVAVARMAEQDKDAALLAGFMARPPVASAWLRRAGTAVAAKDVGRGG
jgi:hypothetical protein